VKRIRAGLVLERSRIIDVADAAPALLEGQTYEVKDLTGVPDNDIDYYAFELGRLQDSAREMIKVFDSPPEPPTSLALRPLRSVAFSAATALRVSAFPSSACGYDDHPFPRVDELGPDWQPFVPGS